MTKPLAILLNGLLAYQPAPLTPLAELGGKLEAIGYEVCITNHFNTGCGGRSPALIIGHSQGGASALALSAKYPAARVVTFDAVRMGRCASHIGCLNFRTSGYPSVPGAVNISLSLSYDHITLPMRNDLIERTIIYAQIPFPSPTANPPSRTNKQQIGRTDRRPRPDPTPPIPMEDFASFEEPDDQAFLLLADRWPNETFGELTLSFEQACQFVHYSGCPK